MLRWSSDTLHIRLCPARVDGTRTVGLWRPRSAGNFSVDCTAMPGAEPWRGAVTALGEGLAEHGRAGARCTIVLSNHFVRYAVLPWMPQLANEREAATAARAMFAEIYGADAAAAWEVQLSAARYGYGRVACATDRALLAELRALCGAARMRLSAVRPYLLARHADYRAQCTSSRYWFAVAEEGRLAVAHVVDGAWRAVHNQRSDRNVSEQIEAILTRESLHGEAAPDAMVYLCAPDLEAMDATELAARNRAGRHARTLQVGFTPLRAVVNS